MGLDPERIERPLGLLMARTTVARRWTRRAVFSHFVAAVFTPEGNGARLSSRHYLIMPETYLADASIPLWPRGMAQEGRTGRVGEAADL